MFRLDLGWLLLTETSVRNRCYFFMLLRFVPEDINMLEQSSLLQGDPSDATLSSHHVQSDVMTCVCEQSLFFMFTMLKNADKLLKKKLILSSYSLLKTLIFKHQQQVICIK